MGLYSVRVYESRSVVQHRNIIKFIYFAQIYIKKLKIMQVIHCAGQQGSTSGTDNCP